MTVEVPSPGSIWAAVSVRPGFEPFVSFHRSRNGAVKAARRARAAGDVARVWHLVDGQWLTLAEADSG